MRVLRFFDLSATGTNWASGHAHIDKQTVLTRQVQYAILNKSDRRLADGTVYNVTGMADTKAAAEEYAAAVAAVIGCAVIWDSERGVV